MPCCIIIFSSLGLHNRTEVDYLFTKAHTDESVSKIGLSHFLCQRSRRGKLFGYPGIHLCLQLCKLSESQFPCTSTTTYIDTCCHSIKKLFIHTHTHTSEIEKKEKKLVHRANVLIHIEKEKESMIARPSNMSLITQLVNESTRFFKPRVVQLQSLIVCQHTVLLLSHMSNSINTPLLFVFKNNKK